MSNLEKLDTSPQSPFDARTAELVRLFPEVRTEGGKLDFDKLKLALGEAIDAGKERYGLNWPGKTDCFKAIQTPSLGTLLPCPKESVNFDTAENVFIEGDNLEVLKLLQKSYLGKVKMIYIDPPYNTGNDFVYPDKFSESLDTYLKYTRQVDAGGRKFGTNTETDGRFHSNWLNMLYPRLMLARTLLRQDGVIMISIDDSEFANLRQLANDVFGEENFCGVIKRRASRKTAFLSKKMTDMCDYVVVYAKSEDAPPLTAGEISDGTRPVFNDGNAESTRVLRRGAVAKCLDGTYAAGVHAARSLQFSFQTDLVVKDGRVVNDVVVSGPWRINQSVLDRTMFVTRNGGLRRTMMEEELGEAKLLNDLLDEPECYNERGSEEVKELLGEKDVFSNPKPTGLIEYLVAACSPESGDIILDFFAGSGTTAHAVFGYCAKHQLSLSTLLVQLPEPLALEIKSQKTATEFCDKLNRPRNIAELTKERLRRAGSRVKKDYPTWMGNADFRVFKLAESNFKPWDSETVREGVKLAKQLDLHVDHLRESRNDIDLLFEILVKCGYSLTTPVETQVLGGLTVYSVCEGIMLACLERKLTLEAIRAIADKKPERVVCLDKGFENNDQLKANAVQIFKSKGVAKFQTV